MSIFLKKTNKQHLDNNLNHVGDSGVIYQYLPIPYQSLDINGNLLDVNLAWLKVLGYAHDDVIGKNFSEFLSDSSREDFKKDFKDFIEKGIASDVPFLLKTKSGAWISVEYSGRAEYDSKGEFISTHCIFRDITAQRNAENALQESEKKFKMIFDNSPLAIVLLDKKGIFIDMNKRVTEWLGYKREDIIDSNIVTSPLFSLKNKAKIANNFTKRLLGKDIGAYDMEFETKDGSTRMGRITATSFKDEQGKVVGDLAMVSDISEERETQGALREAEAQNKLITENTSDFIAITDFSIDAKHLYVNSAYAKFLGYSPEEMVGKKGMDIIHPDDKKLLKPLILKYLKEKSLNIFNKKNVRVSEKIEYRIQNNKGDWCVLASTVNLVDNKLIFVSRDVTEQKKAEERIKKSEENLNKAEAIGKVGSWEYDLATNELWGSDQVKKIFGFNLESDIFSLEEVENLIQAREKVHQALEDLIDKNKPYNIEYKIITKDFKKTISVNSIAELVFDKNKKPVKVVGTIKDVSKEKKVERALKKSEDKMRNIIEHSNELFYIHDTEHNLIYTSPQSMDILGYTEEEMMVKWTTLVTDNPINQKGLEITEKAIKTGKRQKPYHLELEHKNGTKKFVEVNEAPEINGDGKVIGIIGALKDITERKRMEEKMINSATEWLETFNSMSDGISLHSPDYTIVNVNQALCDLLGKRKKEIVGSKCFNIFHDKDNPIEECPMGFTLKNKQEKRVEIFEPKFKKWLSIYTSPIVNDSGEIVKIIHVVRDINERKKAEDEMVKRNQELEKVNAITMGRELKMIELKKKIKKLKEELSKK